MEITDYNQWKSISFFSLFGIFFLLQWIQNRQVLKYWKNSLYNIFTGIIALGLGSLVFQKWIQEQLILSYSTQYIFIVSIIYILFFDLYTYWWHRLNHTNKILWRFHKVHHSDPILSTSSAVRFHFGEVLLSYGLRFLIVSILPVPIISYLVFELIYSFSNLYSHSQIYIPYSIDKYISKLLVGPRFHRIHHSVLARKYNSNYSTIFSFWDRVFKSQNSILKEVEKEMGLKNININSFWNLQMLPFKKK